MSINKLTKGPYHGAYKVEVWKNASMSIVKKTSAEVSISNDVVNVRSGSVQQVMGGIQFYADNDRFSWGYKYIKRITASSGDILWENWDLDKPNQK